MTLSKIFIINKQIQHFLNIKNYFEYILVYRPSYRHNRKSFIVACITYIHVWQRFERYFSHHRAKWIDLLGYRWLCIYNLPFFPIHLMIIFPTMVRYFIFINILVFLGRIGKNGRLKMRSHL